MSVAFPWDPEVTGPPHGSVRCGPQGRIQNAVLVKFVGNGEDREFFIELNECIRLLGLCHGKVELPVFSRCRLHKRVLNRTAVGLLTQEHKSASLCVRVPLMLVHRTRHTQTPGDV